MKSIIILAIILTTSFLSFGQTKITANTNDLIGAWQMKSAEVDGEKRTPKEAFEESQFFQVYSKDNIFESIAGSQKAKGTWKFSKKGTQINFKIGSAKAIMKVKTFSAKKMTLTTEEGGKTLVMNYEKQDGNSTSTAPQLPSEIAGMIDQALVELDKIPKNKSKDIKLQLDEFISQAPNEALKKAAYIYILNTSKSDIVKDYVKSVVNKKNEPFTTRLPQEVAAMVDAAIVDLDKVPESKSKQIKSMLDGFISNAPDEETKNEAYKYILHKSKSNLVKDYVKAVLNNNDGTGDIKSNVTAFTNVNLIDGSGNGVQKRKTIVISEGKIIGIYADKGNNLPEDAKIVDLKGKYVTPGLIDTHVHLATDPSEETYDSVKKRLQELLGNGFLGVRDMGGDGRALAYYARQVIAKQILGPDIHFSTILAGPQFFSDPRVLAGSVGLEPGTGSWAHKVEADTDLISIMQQAKGIGATGVKLYLDVDAVLTAKIVKAAKKVGLKAWSHWEITPANALETVKAGMNIVSHADMIEGVIDTQNIDFLNNPVAAINKNGGAILWKEMIKNNTILDATLAVYMETAGKDTNILAQTITKAAFEAGVKIATGSDTDQDSNGVLAAHIEYRLLKNKVGMTVSQVLNSATIIGAEAIGLENQLGKLIKGKDASFLVYNSNPLKTVTTWNRPLVVVKRGVLFSGKELRNSKKEASSVSDLKSIIK